MFGTTHIDSDLKTYDKGVYCDLCQLKLTVDTALEHLSEKKHGTASTYEIPKQTDKEHTVVRIFDLMLNPSY